MNGQSDNQFEEVQARLAARDELQQQLAATREELNREAYRLDTTQIRLDMAEEEIRKLESLSLDGILSSLLGTKAGKLDAHREECEALQREQDECATAIEALTQQVAQLTQELADFADLDGQPQTPDAADSGRSPSADACAGPGTPQTSAAATRHSLERALEAGESLLNQMQGMYGLCSRLRRGPQRMRGVGALVSTAMRAYTSRVAGGVTAQLAGSVRHFCNQLGQLELETEN